jgi:molybdenum cofactor synthesis domain-containing protein
VAAAKSVTACILIIGDEVLSGRTQDANLKYLAGNLSAIGIRVAEARVIADDEATIMGALNQCRAAHDYVFTTGGIGPTHDDITSASVAKAFGVELVRHPDALALLMRHYRPGDVNEARLKMADVPDGASLIANPVSSAPGFRMGNVFVLAGVPEIMRAMFDGIKHQLAGGPPIRSQSLVAYAPEGAVALPFGELQKQYPDLDMGSYPFQRLGQTGVSLVVRGTDAGRLAEAMEKLKAIVRGLGVEAEDGDGDVAGKEGSKP